MMHVSGYIVLEIRFGCMPKQMAKVQTNCLHIIKVKFVFLSMFTHPQNLEIYGPKIRWIDFKCECPPGLEQCSAA